MQMRLIDADTLQEHFEKVKKESGSLVDVTHIIGMQAVIDNQPTAYDVDRVVEQLDELNDNELAYAKVIHIVKAGGVNE